MSGRRQSQKWGTVFTCCMYFAFADALFAAGDTGLVGTAHYSLIKNTQSDWAASHALRFPSLDIYSYEYTRYAYYVDYLNDPTKWAAGDILFIGDSLTDQARALFDPLFPRSANLSLNGSLIQSVVNMLNVPGMEEALKAKPPSRLFVLVGGGNIDNNADSIPDFEPAEYDPLFDKLAYLRTVLPNSEIILRTIPAIPYGHVPTSLSSIQEANAHLAAMCSPGNFNFRLIDNYDVFMNPSTQRPAGQFIIDYDYHPGQSGYEKWLELLASEVFPLIGPTTGASIATLPSGPTAKPNTSRNITTDLNYRYASAIVPARGTLTISARGTGQTYTSIFDPGNPSLDAALPVAERLGEGFFERKSMVRNKSDIPVTVILCFGVRSALTGTYTLTTTQGTDQFSYTPVDSNWFNDTRLDYMPSVAGDGTGNLMAVWYRGDVSGGYNQAVDLVASTSMDDGATWSNPVVIYNDPAVRIKSRWESNPELSMPWGPNVVWNGSGWSVVFTTIAGNKMREKPLYESWRDVTDLPLIGGFTPQYPWAEYNPVLAYRPADNKLVANWATWGMVGSDNPADLMDLAIASKTPYAGGAWPSYYNGEFAVSSVPRVGHVRAFTTGVHPDKLDTIHAWTEWTPETNTTRLLVGPAHQVISGNFTILNPQLAWHHDSPGNWILSWSDNRDGDFDIYYVIGSADSATWSAMPIPLNRDAATDYDNDYLGQMVSSPALGTRAIWERKFKRSGINVEDSSHVYISDLYFFSVHSFWTAPRMLNTREIGLSKNPRIAPANGKWLHVMEYGQPAETDIISVK